ncbi:MAG: GIY-YIG nuclease family protein [Rickettsiales bacterium]|nr:GIY-YIG nuclease family protein [Rickettsiales bacterium]
MTIGGTLGAKQARCNVGGYVYIITNKPRGTLYIGVTSNLPRRMFEHREGVVKGFSKRYGLKMLVYWQAFDRIEQAIQQEKNMKRWSREWKINAILALNPDWNDLYHELNSG